MKKQIVLVCTAFLIHIQIIGSEVIEEYKQDGDKKKSKNVKEKVFKNIVKPDADPKDYLGIILENELKVLLISDPETDKAVAAMTVGAGTVQDPDDVQGIANLMQFMLCDGSKNYPEPNEYFDFFSKNGGGSGSEVWDFLTRYHMYIPSGKIEEALSRFADIFAAPLLEEPDQLDGEIDIIDQQYKSGALDDWGRLRLVKLDTLPEKSTFRKFSGNEETLRITPKQEGIDIHEKLTEFYREYYSANNMALVVLGKEPVNELQKMVSIAFNAIENRNVKRPFYNKNGPLTETELKKIIYTVPILDAYSLEVDFVVPDATADYKKAPIKYFEFCLNKRSSGSLYSLLHNKGWLDDFSTNYVLYSRGASQFEVLFQLTEDGLEHVNDVLTYLFEYLNLLRASEPNDWEFEEIKTIAELDFQYSTVTDAIYNVERIAVLLLDYPIDEVLHVNVPTVWDVDTIRAYLDNLNAENCRIFVSAKKFEKISDLAEPISGVKYHVDGINEEQIQAWLSAEPDEKLKTPEQNPFIPENLELFPLVDEKAEIPTIIRDTDSSRIWFLQDAVYRVPITFLTVYFRRLQYSTKPNETIKVRLFTALFQDVMDEVTDPSFDAGLRWSIFIENRGITLKINGYSEKLPTLVKLICDSLMNFTFTDTIFRIKKDQIRRNIESGKSYSSSRLANNYLNFLLASKEWTSSELLAALNDITEEEMKAYLNQVFNPIFIEAFLYGNCDESYANEIIDYIETPFKDIVPSLLSIYLNQQRRLFLVEGRSYSITLKAAASKNSAICFYYQCGLTSKQNAAMIDLFNSIISQFFYNTIQNDEKLAFVLCTIVEHIDGVRGIAFIVESSYDIQLLIESLTEFVQSVEEFLKNLTEEELDAYKESLKYSLTYKSDEISQQNDRFLIEISAMTYNFNRYQQKAEKVDEITGKQLMNFYRTYLQTDGKKRTNLFINIIPADGNPSNKLIEKAISIDDLTQFKMTQAVAPLESPANNILPIGIPSEL